MHTDHASAARLYYNVTIFRLKISCDK